MNMVSVPGSIECHIQEPGTKLRTIRQGKKIRKCLAIALVQRTDLKFQNEKLTLFTGTGSQKT